MTNAFLDKRVPPIRAEDYKPKPGMSAASKKMVRNNWIAAGVGTLALVTSMALLQRHAPAHLPPPSLTQGPGQK